MGKYKHVVGKYILKPHHQHIMNHAISIIFNDIFDDG
jgi:hypothetical protein